MSAFTLDTSGSVRQYDNAGGLMGALAWTDLDPFTQGYIEALFASSVGTPEFWVNDAEAGYPEGIGFSDLAPEALAAILADCERFVKLFGEWPLADHGKHFWLGRQKDKHPDFPPLTPRMGDDGKVYLS